MRKLVIAITSFVALSSCQKIIDVDLNEGNPIIVIEAEYNANDSTVRTKISMTTSYFETGAPILIPDAQVFITDGLGNSTLIPVGSDSIYTLKNYIPTYTSTYTLTVVYDGKTYTAKSTLNNVVPQDDIIIGTFPPGPFNSDTSYIPFVRFQDPVNDTNYFEIVLWKNGKAKLGLDKILTQDDAFTNGNFVERPLFSVNYDPGDTVGIELRSIDQQTYNYLNQAISLLNSENSAAPGNPASNWDNDALGYFYVFSSSIKTAVVQ